MDASLRQIASARLIEASADLELQLEKGAGTRPMLIILSKARKAALQAIDGLIYVDPADTTKVRELQFEARRYADLVLWTKETIEDGKSIDREIEESTRDELAALMSTPEGRAEAEALGLDETEGQD